MNRGKITRIKRSVRKSLLIAAALILAFSISGSSHVAASRVDDTTQEEIAGEPDADDNTLDLHITSNAGSAQLESTLQILILLTILSLAPSILIMLTSFTRIIVVMHFLRTALGTQTTPPNQVLAGLSLFMTLAIMSPVFSQINTDAVQPFQSGQVSQQDAIDAGIAPLRKFMLAQTRDKDIRLFLEINEESADEIEDYDDISLMVLIPAFIISELRTAFIIGFLLYLPFIAVDMVVSATLMSMGMMMLPPVTISLPFKILLFVLADGWNLIVGQLVQSFQ